MVHLPEAATFSLLRRRSNEFAVGVDVTYDSNNNTIGTGMFDHPSSEAANPAAIRRHTLLVDFPAGRSSNFGNQS
jgi:hypothetical protein